MASQSHRICVADCVVSASPLMTNERIHPPKALTSPVSFQMRKQVFAHVSAIISNEYTSLLVFYSRVNASHSAHTLY
jgi:hypothetical protein